VATPNHRHKEDCLLCIDAGKAVLCEKPLALNAAEAREIAARARTRGVFLMEAMWMRFIPTIQKAREILRSGQIGRARLMFADFGYPIERDPNGRFLNLELGGGTLLDRGVYPVSLAYFLFGEPEEITGQAAVGPTGVDEQSSVLLRYRDGVQAVLTSTMNAYSTNRATIVGTHGLIEIAPPFFKSESLSVTTFPVAEPNPLWKGGDAAADSSAVGKILGRGHRALSRALGRNPDAIVHSQPLAGNGFNYEAAEVGRCLRAGLLESETMPVAESISILAATDKLRQAWGVVYPADR
jgi:predicted dehydrogenase